MCECKATALREAASARDTPESSTCHYYAAKLRKKKISFLHFQHLLDNDRKNPSVNITLLLAKDNFAIPVKEK